MPALTLLIEFPAACVAFARSPCSVSVSASVDASIASQRDCNQRRCDQSANLKTERHTQQQQPEQPARINPSNVSIMMTGRKARAGSRAGQTRWGRRRSGQANWNGRATGLVAAFPNMTAKRCLTCEVSTRVAPIKFE